MRVAVGHRALGHREMMRPVVPAFGQEADEAEGPEARHRLRVVRVLRRHRQRPSSTGGGMTIARIACSVRPAPIFLETMSGLL